MNTVQADTADRRADDALLGLHSAALSITSAPETIDNGAARERLERVLSALAASRNLFTQESWTNSQLESFVGDIEELRKAAEGNHIPTWTWPVLLQEVLRRLTSCADVVMELIDRQGLVFDVGIEYALSGILPGMAISHVDVERRFTNKRREDKFRRHFGRSSVRLEKGSQLSEVSDGDASFWWDRYWTQGDPNDPGHDDDEITVCALGRGDDVIWEELADDLFELRALAALRERFGDRVETVERGSYAGPRREGLPFD